MAKSGSKQPPKARAHVSSSKPVAAKPSKQQAQSTPPAPVTKMQLQAKESPVRNEGTKSAKEIVVEPDCNPGEMVSADLQAIVGKNLHAARLSASLTLQQVAAQTGMTFQYVSKVEKGEKNVTLSTLSRLASVLRTDISALLRKPPA